MYVHFKGLVGQDKQLIFTDQIFCAYELRILCDNTAIDIKTDIVHIVMPISNLIYTTSEL